ncbi:MAG TPA: hypothetical protein VK053_22345 [Jiangellaceae bacterium]|nr:hypothetical protein [Jiangellaceae bacterium]
MSTTIVVTDEQVDAAQTLVAIKGGADKVAPLIRKIAEAAPRAQEDTRPQRAP